MVAEEEEETKTSDVEEAEEVKEISDMENKAKKYEYKDKEAEMWTIKDIQIDRKKKFDKTIDVSDDDVLEEEVKTKGGRHLSKKKNPY